MLLDTVSNKLKSSYEENILEPGTSTKSHETRMITKLTPSIIVGGSEWDSVVQ